MLAAAILGPSLLIASLAWSAYGMLNTALDPDRSVRIADTLLEDELVQQQLRQSIAGAVGDQIPEQLPVSDEQLESGAGVALQNPVVSVLIRDAFVQAHQAFLGEAEPPTTLDVGAAASDIREGALSGVPGGGELIPDGPGLVIDLPTDQIPNLGGFRRWLQRVAPLMAMIAAAGVALALLTARNRSVVLRRAGTWALGSSAIWLVLNVGLPWLAEQYFSGQAAIASALLDALFGAMLTPAIVLAVCGLALVALSVIWPDGATAGAPAYRTDGGGVLMRRQTMNEGPKPEPLYSAPPGEITPRYVAPDSSRPAAQPVPQPARQSAPEPIIHRPVGNSLAAQQHQQHQQPSQPAPQTQQSQQISRPESSAPKPRPAAKKPPVEPGEWIPGVGYVDPAKPASSEPTGFERPQSPVAKPATPTWIPGQGYVDENGNPVDP